MKAIGFVVRNAMGASATGEIPVTEASAAITAGAGRDVSINLTQMDLRGYSRIGNDLHIALADGRVIVLTGYFDGAGNANGRLFLSADGAIGIIKKQLDRSSADRFTVCRTVEDDVSHRIAAQILG